MAIKNAIEAIKPLAEERQEQLEEINTMYRQRCVEILADELDFIEAPPLIHTFSVMGYTPEWNDGEECVHSNWVPCSYDDVTIDVYGDDLVDDKEFRRQYNIVAAHFENQHGEDLMDQITELIGTNWKITLTFVEGALDEVEIEDYDCGH